MDIVNPLEYIHYIFFLYHNTFLLFISHNSFVYKLSHGLFDYIQLFVISNGVNTRYFANNPNIGYKFTFNWTDASNHPFNEFYNPFLGCFEVLLSYITYKIMQYGQEK